MSNRGSLGGSVGCPAFQSVCCAGRLMLGKGQDSNNLFPIFIEELLCTKACSKCWEYKNKTKPKPEIPAFWIMIGVGSHQLPRKTQFCHQVEQVWLQPHTLRGSDIKQRVPIFRSLNFLFEAILTLLNTREKPLSFLTHGDRDGSSAYRQLSPETLSFSALEYPVFPGWRQVIPKTGKWFYNHQHGKTCLDGLK